MKQFFLILLVVVSWHVLAAQMSSSENFNLDWKFHFGHAQNPAKDFHFSLTNLFSKTGAAQGTAIDPKFNDSSWQTLQLPHDWAVALPFVNADRFDATSHGYKPVGGHYPETSIGWYRKSFYLPVTDSGKRISIQFDGMFRDAQVWINGFYLGNHKSGYTGVTYDISDYIFFNKNNTLVVRLDATQYEGWFYEGAGIYRNVWLHKQPALHLNQQEMFVHSSQNRTITAEIPVQNFTLTKANCTVEFLLKNREGLTIATSKSAALQVPPFQQATALLKLSANNLRLWSLADPYLHRIQVVLKQNNRVVDSYTLRFGVRTFTVTPNGFFINGVRTKILGTNNHQDHAGIGTALPNYLQYYRIQLLQKMGSNAYRASHHAPSPELLDACDSLGMLVMSEQRLLNSSTEYMQQWEWLLKRDRNRASVFMWSIGNEEGWVQTNGNGKRIAQSLLQKQQILDPTRTATYAADLANVFNGINEVIPVRGFNYREYAVEAYKQNHPQQPIIGTEMGSTVTTRGIYYKDSVEAYVPDNDITAPWWASTAETWWKLAANNHNWLGGFIWTGLDYRGEPTPYQWPNISSHFGVMDVCGFPKNIYYYYKSWWTNEEVLHIGTHWNPSILKNKKDSMVDVWVYSNAQNVELFLNNQSLGKQTMPVNGHLQWKVHYAPGTLKAIGYKKGKRLEATVATTGPAAEVVVTPYKTTFLANGEDAVVVNISAIDKEGRLVPDADHLIQFHISGDAAIIGVGNGNPSSHEQDICLPGQWQRKLFNGKAQLILRAGHKPGIVLLDAESAGLWKGSTELHGIDPKNLEQVKPLAFTKPANIKISSMLGADISFLPELEAKGKIFKNQAGQKTDALSLLKENGFNYIRLRIFHSPDTDSGYAPKTGFCNLAYTLAMAKRAKAAGMQVLLDFHYSDNWADPQKQWGPQAWKGLSGKILEDSLYQYTRQVLLALKAQGTLPNMVQIGNEINHGMVWPYGTIQQVAQLMQLLQAGIAATRSVDANLPIMLHVALGGQLDEVRFFLEQAAIAKLDYQVIGLSYYPKWHGTPEDLQFTIQNIAKAYPQDIIVVEYSHLKQVVNKIAFEAAGSKAKGSCIWEPLNTWERFFDEEGNPNHMLAWYQQFAKEWLR
jgi:beta-galactosidase